MLVGYNTNVPYKGKTYHIQTEDSGLKNPVVITLLYYKGTILASKKVSYSEFISDPDCKEKVRELMKEQHKTMMKELIRGTYTKEQSGKPDEKAGQEKNAKDSDQETQNTQEGRISGRLDNVLPDCIIKGEE